MRVLGVNGIHSDGAESTHLILQGLKLRGHEVIDVHQRRRSSVTAWLNAENDAEAICDVAQTGDWAVGHSYGGLKLGHAAKYVEFGGIVLFSPAMERNWRWDQGQTPPDRVYCIHSLHDFWIWLGNKIPWHPFGNAGRLGFLDKRCHNYLAREVTTHSGYFHGAELSRWTEYVHQLLTGEREGTPTRPIAITTPVGG